VTTPEEAEDEAYKLVFNRLEDWKQARFEAGLESLKFTPSGPVGDDGRMPIPEKWPDSPDDMMELRAAQTREHDAWDALQEATKDWRAIRSN
jgi:hypothetical protein